MCSRLPRSAADNPITGSGSGASFSRSFYGEVFQNLTMAFGNFTAPPTDASPYLPSGVVLGSDSPDVPLAFLEEVRGRFPDASHHTWAFRLGRTGETFRFHDDGEPGERVPNVFYGAYVRDLDGNKFNFFCM